jgi:hypothetical protein
MSLEEQKNRRTDECPTDEVFFTFYYSEAHCAKDAKVFIAWVKTGLQSDQTGNIDL